jgi:hypothetical protein
MPLHCTSRVQLEGRNREKVMEEMAEKLPKRDAMMMKDLTGHDDQMAATMADTAAAGKVYRSDLAPCMDRACTPHIPARTCHAYSACYVPCQAAWKSAENVGTGWEAAAPLAPKDGFYNERYRCRTMASFDMGDRDDFEKLFCGDEEEPAGERLTLAFKGINDDHCQVVYYSLLTTHYSLLTTHCSRPTTCSGALQIIADLLKDERCLCKSLWLNDNQIRHEVRLSEQYVRRRL